MRGNQERGIVPWEVGGQELLLKFGWDARAELQDELGFPVQDLTQKFQEGDLGAKEVRALVWATLNDAPNGKRFSLSEASSLIEEAQHQGDFEGLVVAIRDAMIASNPDVDESDLEEAQEDAEEKN